MLPPHCGGRRAPPAATRGPDALPACACACVCAGRGSRVRGSEHGRCGWSVRGDRKRPLRGKRREHDQHDGCHGCQEADDVVPSNRRHPGAEPARRGGYVALTTVGDPSRTGPNAGSADGVVVGARGCGGEVVHSGDGHFTTMPQRGTRLLSAQRCVAGCASAGAARRAILLHRLLEGVDGGAARGHD